MPHAPIGEDASPLPSLTFNVDPVKHNILYVDGHFGVANLLAMLSAMLSPDKGFHEAFTVNFINRGPETAVWIMNTPFSVFIPIR